MTNKPVDLLALREVNKLVKAAMPTVQGVRATDPAMFGRMVMTAAYRYAVIHAVPDLLAIVDLLSPEYITSTLPAQMDEDPKFATLAERVATELVAADVVVPEYAAGDQFCYPEALA